MIDGKANDKVTAQLVALDMREQEGGMSSLEMRFTNFGSFPGGLGDMVFEDGVVLKHGAAVQLYAGDVNSPTEIFRGTVTALEGRFPSAPNPPDLVVLAEDALQRARMKRRSKSWTATNLAEIARAVASNLGVTPVMDGLDTSIGDQQQFNESDLRFLRRLLARYDADAQIVGTELHVGSRAQAHRSAIELQYLSQLKEVTVLADLAHQTSKVTATGWDYVQGSPISATSSGTSLGPGAGKTGKDWLERTLGPRSEQIGDLASMNASEAQAIVDADFAQRARTFAVARGVSQGNPNLRVGSWLTLLGIGPRFSNTYYTTSTVHHFDTEIGYETHFTAECAYLGGPS